MRLCVAFLAACLAVGPAAATQATYDCKMRQLGLDFAQSLQPFRPLSVFQEIADALNGSPEAQKCSVAPNASLVHAVPRPSFVAPGAAELYVDANTGSDSNPGTLAAPLKTIGKAVSLSRQQAGAKVIFLREGTFYLPETLQLGPQDSSLTITAYQSEEVWISGGIPLSPVWSPYPLVKGGNVYVSTISLPSIPGLRQDGGRLIRARFPNGNPETGFDINLKAEGWVAGTNPTGPETEIYPETPLRNSSTQDYFQRFQLGIGGTCDIYDPPAGFWCSNNTGRDGVTYIPRAPLGVTASKKILPNSPYATVEGAVAHVWRQDRWFTWMFDIGSFDASSSSYMFSKGGFQGAEGTFVGDSFYIENVLEELDSPAEWYFNSSTQQLFLWYNGTGAPPADTVFVATNLQVLVNITGTSSSPVVGVALSGLGFRDTAYTYMEPHGLPSGGDWALARTGAVFLQGTENCTIDSSVFTRLDTVGVFLSGYNRAATISRSEFSWLGESAIALWGYSDGVPEVPGFGWDGTGGEQPRGTAVLFNHAHDLGLWEKQSSFFFQAQSALTLLQGNIFYNGPRAGINFNDGFGGGSNLTYNILFNTCRESADHGPFNSWDRQVYVTDVLNGTPSVTKQWDDISHNFMIANYNSQEAIDNDDGSCYYHTHHNVFSYSGNGMKNDFGGHDNIHHNNLYAYIGKGFGICPQVEGHLDGFYNNTVVLRADGAYTDGTCGGPTAPIVHDNAVYSPTGNVTECGMSLSKWQAEGNDPGSTAAPLPDDETLIALATQLLGL